MRSNQRAFVVLPKRLRGQFTVVACEVGSWRSRILLGCITSERLNGQLIGSLRLGSGSFFFLRIEKY